MGCCQSDAGKPKQLNRKGKKPTAIKPRSQRGQSESPMLKQQEGPVTPQLQNVYQQDTPPASHHHHHHHHLDSSYHSTNREITPSPVRHTPSPQTMNGATLESRQKLLETVERSKHQHTGEYYTNGTVTRDSYGSLPPEAPRLGTMLNPIENGLVAETPQSQGVTPTRALTVEEGGRLLMTSQRGNVRLNKRIEELTRFSPPNADTYSDEVHLPTISYRNNMNESMYSNGGDPTLAQPTARANMLFGIAMQGGDIEGSGIPVVKLKKAMETDDDLRQSTGWPESSSDHLLDLLLSGSEGFAHGTAVTQYSIKHYCTCRWIFDLIDVRHKGEFTGWDLATALRDSPDVSRELGIPPYLATPLFRQISPGKPTATLVDFYTFFHATPLRFASEPVRSYRDVLSRLLPDTDTAGDGCIHATDIIDRLKADRYLQLELGWSDPTASLSALGSAPSREASEQLLKLRWAWTRADSAHDGFIGACELGDALQESDVAFCLNRRVGDVKELWRELDTSETGVTMWFDFYRYFADEGKRARDKVPRRKAALTAALQSCIAITTYAAVSVASLRRNSDGTPQPQTQAPVPTPRHPPPQFQSPTPPKATAAVKSPPAPTPGVDDDVATPKHRSVTPPRPLPPPRPALRRGAISETHPQPRKPRHHDPAPLFPQQPGDRYNKVKKLGEGNFGVVYLVERKSDGLQLVAKEPKRPVGSMTAQKKAADAKRMRKVQKEAAHLMRLKHPNILRFIEAYWEHGALVIVTEYCDGGDLATWLTRFRSTASISTKWTIFQQIAEAIRYMHDRSILHRDLKPANILLTIRGVVKLADFGLARALVPEEEAATTICGTELYMAPEVHSRMPYGMPADIFALGCILYQMSKGRKPYVNLLELLECKPPQDAPKYCLRLVKEMLNVNPDARPSINQVLRRCPEYRPRRRQAKLLLLVWARHQKREYWPESRLAARVLSYVMLLPF